MGNIQMVGKSSAPMFRGEKPLETKLAPTFSLDEVAKHAVDFWLSTEDLARPENRVTLAKDGNITLSYTPNNQEPKKRLYNQLKSMLGHLGMHPDHLIPRTTYLKNEIPIAGVAHQAGTVRFGTDPGDIGPRCRLQGPRAGQPVRRGHELLPQHRRREPGPDGDGQRVASGRASPRTAGGPPRSVTIGRRSGRLWTRLMPRCSPRHRLTPMASRREVAAFYGAGWPRRRPRRVSGDERDPDEPDRSTPRPTPPTDRCSCRQATMRGHSRVCAVEPVALGLRAAFLAGLVGGQVAR